MPNVLALFDDAQALENAQRQLEQIQADDDVVRVFRAASPEASRSPGPKRREEQAHVVSQQGEVAATGAPTGSAADLGLDAFGEAGGYFWRAHQEGAHLMVLDVEDPDATGRALRKAGAQRIHTI